MNINVEDRLRNMIGDLDHNNTMPKLSSKQFFYTRGYLTGLYKAGGISKVEYIILKDKLFSLQIANAKKEEK